MIRSFNPEPKATEPLADSDAVADGSRLNEDAVADGSTLNEDDGT
jgi:hypothetical protein